MVDNRVKVSMQKLQRQNSILLELIIIIIIISGLKKWRDQFFQLDLSLILAEDNQIFYKAMFIFKDSITWWIYLPVYIFDSKRIL